MGLTVLGWLVGVAAQLARRASASCDAVLGSAVYAVMVRPGSAGSGSSSNESVRSPTTGWWKRLSLVVEAHVVAGPSDAELVASGGEFAHEVVRAVEDEA